MDGYKRLGQQIFTTGDYRLQTVRADDIMRIKDWRNAQMKVLRQKEWLTTTMQQQYFATVIWPSLALAEPPQFLFSFFYQEECIGYGGIVHISWEDRRGEVSFLLEPERATDQSGYRRDFLAFLYLIKKIAYEELRLNRLFTETFDIRPFHISILEEAGFQQEGRLKQHILHNGSFIDSVLHGHLRIYGD